MRRPSRTRRSTALVLSLGLAALAAACSPSPDVAATVEGVSISVAEVRTAEGIFRMLGDLSGSGCGFPVEGETEEAACARYALSNLLRIEVARQWADDNGVSADPTEAQDAVDRLDADLQPDGLAVTSERYGVTPEDVLELASGLILFGEVRIAVTEQTVTDEELRAEYDASLDFTQIRTKHILVDDEATAADLAARATDENFSDLAREFSTDPSAEGNGGDLGLVVASSFVEPFARAAIALQPGEISQPVQTEFGWHVILLVELVRTPFESARDALLGARSTEVYATWLQERLGSLDIEVNPSYGVLDPMAGEVAPARSTGDASTAP